MVEAELPIDSPVLHAIPQLTQPGVEKEYEARLAALERDREVLRAQLEVSERTNLSNQGTLEALSQAIENLGKQLSEPQRREAEVAIESLVREKRAGSPVIPAAKLPDS